MDKGSERKSGMGWYWLDAHREVLRRISKRAHEGLTSEEVNSEEQSLISILSDINEFCLMNINDGKRPARMEEE